MRDGEHIEVDLTDKFILVVWVYYTANMCTRPALSSNACQKVLAYFLTNTHGIVKTWRHRMYNYSSGTIMLDVKQPIVDWIEENDSAKKEQALRRLDNSSKELYPLVSTFETHRFMFTCYSRLYFVCLSGVRGYRAVYKAKTCTVSKGNVIPRGFYELSSVATWHGVHLPGKTRP